MDKQSVRDLVAGYSIETTVREASRLDRYADLVPAGTAMYIPHVPGVAREDTIALAARLRREGMDPVPHVVARRTESAAILDDFLKRLVGEAGVTRCLEVLYREMELTMAFCGHTDIRNVDRAILLPDSR